jgi:hypothetical protein
VTSALGVDRLEPFDGLDDPKRLDFGQSQITLATLESHDHNLYGNGRPGRVDTLEERTEELKRWRWLRVGAGAGCAAVISVIAWARRSGPEAIAGLWSDPFQVGSGICSKVRVAPRFSEPF